MNLETRIHEVEELAKTIENARTEKLRLCRWTFAKECGSIERRDDCVDCLVKEECECKFKEAKRMNWVYNENKFQYELYDWDTSSNCLCVVSESAFGTIRAKELVEHVNLFFEKDNSELEKRVEKLENINQ